MNITLLLSVRASADVSPNQAEPAPWSTVCKGLQQEEWSSADPEHLQPMKRSPNRCSCSFGKTF